MDRQLKDKSLHAKGHGNTLTCGWTVTLNGSVLVSQVLEVLLYLTSRRGKLKKKGLHANGHAAEGQESPRQGTGS
jgi:hypothetical protein